MPALNSDAVIIAPSRLEDVPGFHAALDNVARERLWLARNEAPPLEKTIAFVTRILNEGFVQLLAHRDGKVIGWCDVFPRSDDPAVGVVGMGLIKDARGQGIGQKLLSEALGLAQGRFSRIELDVRLTNPAAIALYQKMGFVIERQYYRDTPGVEAELYTMVWQP